MITQKYLRSLYPRIREGHRKNCSCFVCGLDRQSQFEIDHPYEANKEIARLQAIEDKKLANYKEQRHNSELKMTRVLSGNKYYKELDTMSYYDLVEYKIIDAPAPCYKHPSWSHDSCDCERPMVKTKVVANEADVKFLQEKDTLHCSECYQRLGNTAFGCPCCGSYATYVFGKMLKNPADRRWTLPRYSKDKYGKSYAESQLINRTKKLDKPDDFI